MINASTINGAMSYVEYKNLLTRLLAEGKTTGHPQTAEHFEFAKINIQRMARIEKTLELSADLKTALAHLDKKLIWLVITEGWCGDASQNLPLLNAVAEACPAIELKLILRDDNLDLIDRYLTNGTRSIPKLICLEAEGLNELFTWGPRPEELQQMVMQLVKNGVSKEDRGTAIQKWYNNDKTKSLQAELLSLIRLSIV